MKYPVEFPTKLIIPNPEAEVERERNKSLGITAEVSDIKSTIDALAVIDLTSVTGFSRNVFILPDIKEEEITSVELHSGEITWNFYMAYDEFKAIYNHYLTYFVKDNNDPNITISIVHIMNFKEILNNLGYAKDSTESPN